MIEGLIFRAINEIPLVQSGLAGYGGYPAVFWQLAASDTDPNWDTDKMYPRIDYGVNWEQNPERKTAGSLIVNVWCTNESETPAEAITEALQTGLSELFMTDESETYSIVWERSDYFEAEGDKEPKTVGYTLTFDVLAFPVQETVPPDPVWAVNQLVKEILPGAKVIGHDMLESLWRPTDESPAIYTRIVSNGTIRTSYACSWLSPTLGLHVIAPDPAIRQKILQILSHEMHLRGEAITNDGSPFFFQKLQYTTSAEPLRNGQMTISGAYGVLSREPEYEKLWHPSFERRLTEDGKIEKETGISADEGHAETL